MVWFAPVHNYCQQLNPGFWAESVNALSNLGFIIAAGYAGHRLRGTGLTLAYGMVALLILIGLCGFVFYASTRIWSDRLEVVLGALFVMLYLFAASRDFLGLAQRWSALISLGFLPAAILMGPNFSQITFIGISSPSLPFVFLTMIFFFALRNRAAQTAKGLQLGSAILLLSVLLHSLYDPLCNRAPFVAQFVWPVLNSLVLAYVCAFMILIYQRHMLAPPRPGR